MIMLSALKAFGFVRYLVTVKVKLLASFGVIIHISKNALSFLIFSIIPHNIKKIKIFFKNCQNY